MPTSWKVAHERVIPRVSHHMEIECLGVNSTVVAPGLLAYIPLVPSVTPLVEHEAGVMGCSERTPRVITDVILDSLVRSNMDPHVLLVLAREPTSFHGTDMFSLIAMY